MKRLLPTITVLAAITLIGYANRPSGLLDISANFEPEIAAPFDARATVPSVAVLTNATTFGEYAYVGMSVLVHSDADTSANGMYWLRETPSTVLDNWERVQGGGGTGTSDHAALTNLAWSASGHTGTANKVAGFDSAGNATYYEQGEGSGSLWEIDLAGYLVPKQEVVIEELWEVDGSGYLVPKGV